MKETRMPPAYSANLVANSGNTIYGVSVINILSTLWLLMAWCFSTRASVATVLDMHPCVSSCLRARVGVNSIPELELQVNSNSNSGIGIGIEIGGIENGIGIENPGIGIGIENRN